jgi:hypothetical protein
MEELLMVSSEQLMRIAIYVIVLLVIWGFMRLVLRITKRVFQFGCFAILLLGGGLLLLQMFGGG